MNTSQPKFCSRCGNSFQKYSECPKCRIPLGPKKNLLRTTTIRTQKRVLGKDILVDIPETQDDTVIIYKNEEPFHSFPIPNKKEILIGRAPSCDIWF
ncbi:MAG: hypothetical protein D6785_04015, partial [Planctomycetota bacterium]